MMQHRMTAKHIYTPKMTLKIEKYSIKLKAGNKNVNQSLMLYQIQINEKKHPNLKSKQKTPKFKRLGSFKVSNPL